MNLLKNIILIFFLFIVFSACNSGKKAFQRGDYYEASIQAVKMLRSNPESEKAKTTISQSYPMALQYYQQKIDEISITNSTDKFLSIADIYSKLNSLADEISRCPAALEIVKPVVYFHDQFKKANEMAIAEQYNFSVQLLDNGTLQDARKAYEKFDWVNKTSPGYSQVLDKLKEAEFMATLRVVVEKLPYIGDQYQANLNQFYDKIFIYLIKNAQGKFLKFYKPQEAEKLMITPNEVVKMQFVDFSVGNIYEKETEKEFISDTLVIGTSRDDKGAYHDVLGTVKAKATIHERVIVSKGRLDVKIINYQNSSIIESKQFPGEYSWRNDWATYNGDERALPDNIRTMSKTKQILPPAPQDLFLFFSDQPGANASSFLKSYYRNK